MNVVKKYLRNVSEIISSRIPQSGAGNIVFSLLFLVILLIPMIEDISTASPISSQSFLSKDLLISYVNNFKYSIMKDRVFNGLLATQKGWLSYTFEFSLDDFQHSKPFTDEQLERIDSRLKFLCASLTTSGTRLILVFPPNKNTIYPENMPPEIVQMKQLSRLDQVMNSWSNTDYCKMIDLRSALFEAKKTNQVYFSTDTHWNAMGAFIAYQILSRKMQINFPAIKVREITDFQLVPRPYAGELTAQYFGHLYLAEITTNVTPSFTTDYSAFKIANPKGLKYGANQIIVSCSNNKNLPTAIIYHDSFFNVLYPFINENFSEALYFWSYNIDLDFLKYKKPDYLILEVTERFLADGLLFLPTPK